jgi:7-carboxy-7-deazaguanine synthase
MSSSGAVVAGRPPEAAPVSRPTEPRLALPAEERLKVNEIFVSLQGESTRAGWPCALVRLTGCQMRCVWCDSEHSFYEGRWMSRREVLAAVASLACPMVEVTGGEPLLQPGTVPLLAALCDQGHEVLLETGGGLDISRVDPRVRRIVDIKCPDSGEAANNRWENLDLLTARDELKLVIASWADYLWAREVVLGRGLWKLCPVSFSAVWGRIEPRQLADWVVEDRLPVRFQLQLHKVLWGADTRGV